MFTQKRPSDLGEPSILPRTKWGGKNAGHPSGGSYESIPARGKDRVWKKEAADYLEGSIEKGGGLWAVPLKGGTGTATIRRMRNLKLSEAEIMLLEGGGLR